MNKEAVISIISNSSIESEEMIEVISPGYFEQVEDGFKATYEETEISGMKGTTTTLTIKDKEVVLEREGTTSTKMVFNEKEDSVCLYNTPYGMLEIEINTKSLEVNINNEGGDLKIEYEMRIVGQPSFSTKLSLSIKLK